MKTLYLVRHAKSSWKETSIADFDRPLNKRGNRDAPFMGDLLKRLGAQPDLVISSPANRALSTAEIFAEKLGYPSAKIKQDKELYLADSEELLEVIKAVDDKVLTLMLFSHNPGLTDLSNFLCNKEIENIPTCGIVKIEIKKLSWKDITDQSGSFIWFEYPKKYFK